MVEGLAGVDEAVEDTSRTGAKLSTNRQPRCNFRDLRTTYPELVGWVGEMMTRGRRPLA